MPFEVTVEATAVNAERLGDELADLALPGYQALSTGPGWIKALFEAEPPPGVIDQVRAAVAAHNPAELSRREQQEAERAAQWAALRKPWGEWTPADKEEFLRLLAGQLGLLPDSGIAPI